MTKIKAQDDLYYFVNQKWEKNKKIPNSYSKWSIFNELHEKNLKKINNIIIQSNNNIIKILSKQFLNKKHDNFLIQKIKNIKSKNELILYLGKFNQFNFGTLLHIYIIPDLKNSNYNLLGISPSLLFLPDNDYFVNKQKFYNENIRLKKFIEDLCNLLKIKQNYDEIEKIQMRISKKMMSKENKRIPEKGYNVYNLKTLKKNFPNFNWDFFFKSCNINYVKEIIVDDINQLKEFDLIFHEYSLDTLKNIFLLKYVISISDLLDNKIENKIFNFYGNFLSGIKKMKSKKKGV